MQATAGVEVRTGGQRLTVARAALIVFAISLAVRATWAAFAHITPISDFAGYDRLAWRWLETGRFGSEGWMAYRTPGYPAFLAAVYAVFGHSPKAAGIVQAVFGACSSMLLVLLAARFLCARVALLAGLLHAAWPTAVVYVPVLASENLAVPLLLLTLLCLAAAPGGRAARRYALTAVAGACFGYLLLVRPASVFLLPAGVLIAVALNRRWGRVLAPVAFLACMGVTLAPWLVRNYRAGLGPCTLSTVGSMNFWMGNNPGQTRGGTYHEDLLPPRLGEKQRDQAYRKLAMDWIRADPRRYLALCRTRALRMLLTEPDTTASGFLTPTRDNDRLVIGQYRHRKGVQASPDDLERMYRLYRRNNSFLSWLRAGSVPVMLLGLVLAVPRWRRYGVFTVPFLFYLAGLSATMFAPRFRELGEPLLLVPAAALLLDLFTGSRELRGSMPRWLLLVLALGAVGATLSLERKGALDSLYRIAAPPKPAASLPAEQLLEIHLAGLPGLSPLQSPSVESVELRHASDGLHCVVIAGEAEPARLSRVGGVRIPVSGWTSLCLEMTLQHPESIEAVYVETRDHRNRPVQQWSWRVGPQRPADAQRHTYVFSPGLASGYFQARSAGAGTRAPTELCVYIRVSRGQTAGFVLHYVMIGESAHR
jgi:4-amino-4-deoxy-L-arabinose transferase-like glycosyltransferase